MSETGDTVPALSMRGVSKRFGPTVALASVELAVRPGEVHALVGQNGAGKSTLMGVLSGAVRPDEGEVRVGGRRLVAGRPIAARRAGVAMIYQELNLAPHLSVADNVALGVERSRAGVLRRGEQRAIARAALARLDHGHIDVGASCARLSLAERQVVEIARALASEASVVVMDEPTSSLGREDIERLFEAIGALRASGAAVVYISHFLEEVGRVADRWTVLRNGRVAGTGEVAGTPIDRLIELMAGQRLAEMYPRRESRRAPGEVVLTLRAGGPALEVREGEVVGIAGLVGAGRTELLRRAFGLDRARGGRRRSVRASWRASVGMVCEDRAHEGLALTRTIRENVRLGAPTGGAPGVIRHREERRRVGAEIARLSIEARGPEQRVGSLSGGNQQKVMFARVLDRGSRVLLLDEPTRGVDVTSKAQIYRVIAEAADAGRAVVMVSSYPPELLGVCDRVAVMHRGVLGGARPAGEWSEHEIVRVATVGEAKP